MTEDNRKQNLLSELQKGDASLKAAELCVDAGLWDDAVSRAFYAAYHHVHALLFSVGAEPRSYAGTHDQLYFHFVKSGRFDSQLSRRFAALQRYREQADYSRVYHFDEQGAREEVESANAICAAVRLLLGADGWLS